MYIYIYIHIYIYIYICVCVGVRVCGWVCVYLFSFGKTELIFFIPLYFCFYFQELENISPIHFTSTKWEKPK